MKINIYGDNIQISNIPKTVIGIICTFAYPVFYILTLLDLFKYAFENVGWFDISLVIILPSYIIWLFKEFRTEVLRYKIYIDEYGVSEKRLFGKTRTILWRDIEEYACEIAPAPYKTNEPFFEIVFSSKHENKFFIRTWSFPESKKEFFKKAIFEFCDQYFTG